MADVGIITDLSGKDRPPGTGFISNMAQALGGLFYRHPQWTYGLLSGAAVVFLFAFFGYPLLAVFKLAIFEKGWTGRYFQEIIQSPQYLRVFIITFRVAALVTFLTLILGYPMAALLVRARKAWQQILFICILLPFWTSVLVRTYAWMILLGRRGLINQILLDLGLIDAPLQLLFNTTGSVIGMTHIMLPYMIFPIYSVMNNIDPQLLRAAYNLGAKPWQAFIRIFFPLSPVSYTHLRAHET